MKTLAYNCKFCGLPGTAEYQEDVGVENLDFWKGLLACNRCADFHAARLKLFRRITEICVNLNQARLGRFKDLKELEDISGVMLETNTKKLCHLVSRFFNVVNVWNYDFVKVLLERPEHAWKSCEFYVKQRERDSRLKPAPPTEPSFIGRSQPKDDE